MASQFSAKGRLYVTVIECRDLANKELVGKMDPYVTLDITGSKEKHKTKVVTGGHINPKFNQSFIFNLEGKEDLFHANVYDRETVGYDDHVGRADMGLDKIDITDKPHWYELRDRNNFAKFAGSICLSCRFEGSGWPGQTTITPTPPAPAPAPAKEPAPAAAPAPTPAPQQPPQPTYVFGVPPQFQPGAVYATSPQSLVYAQPQPAHHGSFIYAHAAPGQPIMSVYGQPLQPAPVPVQVPVPVPVPTTPPAAAQPIVYGQPLQPLQQAPMSVMYGAPPQAQPQVIYGAPMPVSLPQPMQPMQPSVVFTAPPQAYYATSPPPSYR